MAYSNQLKRVINLIGPHAAIRMSRCYGGRAYRVPKKENLHDMHPLVVTIGLAKAESLVEHFENTLLKFPSEVDTLQQIRNGLIVLRHREGESMSAIALDLQIDRKMVQKVIKMYTDIGMGKVIKNPLQLILV